VREVRSAAAGTGFEGRDGTCSRRSIVFNKLYRSLALPLALGALTVAAGCGGGDETPPPTGTSRSLDIVADEYKFTPSLITASPGEVLTITLKNNGKMEHSLKFDLPGGEKGIEPNIAPSETGHLTITAPSKAGSYKFYSPADDDRKKGLEGQL
jgi:plastocyanin